MKSEKVGNNEQPIRVEDALHFVLSSERRKEIVYRPLMSALGMVLGEDIVARENIPPFIQSNVDGYAFSYNDWKGRGVLQIQEGKSIAGNTTQVILKQGYAVRVFTGAPVPVGADTIVMQEHVRISDNSIIISHPIEALANVRAKGSDITRGNNALYQGTVINAPVLGFLASMGYTEVPVIRSPKVAVLITGDEVVQPGRNLEYGQIYDANSTLIRSVLSSGIQLESIVIKYVKDVEQEVVEVLKRFVSAADMVIISGGASVGDFDFVARAAEVCGVNKVFHRVKQKPGKPLYYGKKGTVDIFGLPGNPSSVLTCLYLYVLPALYSWLGYKEQLKLSQFKIQRDYIKPEGLTVMLKGKVYGSFVVPLQGQESYRLSSYAVADSIIILPEDVSLVKAGTYVDVYKIPNNYITVLES